MSTVHRPRFDPHALREHAGDTVFARGENYFADGVVELLSVEPGRVLALVAGTEDYRTVLTGQGTEIGGECSCPAFDRDGFCKHMVATALEANDAATSGDAEGEDTLTRIRRYLASLSVDALVRMVVDHAERDPALFRKLEMAAATIELDDTVLEAKLRKAVRDATRIRGYVDYDRAPHWAAGVGAMLDALAGLASGPHAGLVSELAGEAVLELERAIGSIDDSDGHCTDLAYRAQEIHFEACRAARPDPVALARDLFRREMEGEFDVFSGAAVAYAEILGEDGIAEYRRLASEAWDALPTPESLPRQSAIGANIDLYRLTSMLDYFAERDGDVERRIALRAGNLSSTWAYLNLAEFCVSQGRRDEALRRAEDGLWMFEDKRPDERLVFFAVDLLMEAGREAEAQAHLWRAFEKEPSLNLYRRLRKFGRKEVSQRAIEFLEGRLARETPSKWHYPADFLVRVLVDEKMFDTAWALVDKHGASLDVKERLSKASEKTHPRQALEVYAQRVESLVEAGGNPAYKKAAGVIAHMADMQGAEEQSVYTAGLKERHKRKRNFMKLLSER